MRRTRPNATCIPNLADAKCISNSEIYYKTPSQVIEVETIDTIDDAARQLQGYQRRVYVAGADDAAAQAALGHYKDTTIGVMDPSGKILKSSSRKRSS